VLEGADTNCGGKSGKENTFMSSKEQVKQLHCYKVHFIKISKSLIEEASYNDLLHNKR